MFEPTGNARMAAKATRDLFLAYVAEGFTEDQAMMLITTLIQTHKAA